MLFPASPTAHYLLTEFYYFPPCPTPPPTFCLEPKLYLWKEEEDIGSWALKLSRSFSSGDED